MNKKQSLFHICQAGRPALVQESGPSGAAAIVLALLVCAVVTMLMTGENPIEHLRHHFQGRLRHRPQDLGHLPESGGSAGNLSGGDAGVQDAVLEHRRRGAGAYRRPGHRRLHDLSG